MDINGELNAYIWHIPDYNLMPSADQARIDIMRLESRFMRFEQEDIALKSKEREGNVEKNIICFICFDKIQPNTNYNAFNCGHFICNDCFLQNAVYKCPTCRIENDPQSIMILRFRFNEKKNTICRICMIEFNENTVIYANRCGDVFCYKCFGILRDRCVCGRPMSDGYNFAIRLYPSYYP